MHSMDDLQEVQLRSWAEALCGAAESDRRAMGKAILMLLEQIDSLRAALEQPPNPQAPPTDDLPGHGPSPDPQADLGSVQDAAAISLRDRLRAAAHRHHK
jgi:hypothetical protein